MINDDWGAGYCATVTVSTTSTANVDWRVSVPLAGTITNLWNATYTVSAGILTAEGLSWNNFVRAGQPAVFGFCAKR